MFKERSDDTENGLSFTEVAARVALTAAKLDGDAATSAMHESKLEVAK